MRSPRSFVEMQFGISRLSGPRRGCRLVRTASRFSGQVLVAAVALI